LRLSKVLCHCRRPPPLVPGEPVLTVLRPRDRSSGLHGPALPDMGFRNRASSNFSSDIVPESGSTDFVEDLLRLQADAAADDLFWISVVPPKPCRIPDADK